MYRLQGEGGDLDRLVGEEETLHLEVRAFPRGEVPCLDLRPVFRGDTSHGLLGENLRLARPQGRGRGEAVVVPAAVRLMTTVRVVR